MESNPPDPSRSFEGLKVPIPSEKNRILGVLAFSGHTPPKTNMEPENDGSQKDSPLQRVHFPVPC